VAEIKPGSAQVASMRQAWQRTTQPLTSPEKITVMADSCVLRSPWGGRELAIARLHHIAIAVVVVMIAGFVPLGVQVGGVNGRINELSAKLHGLDATLGVKFEAANARTRCPNSSGRTQDDAG